MDCCKNCKHWNQLKEPHNHLGQCTNDKFINNIEVWHRDIEGNGYKISKLFSHNLAISTISGMSCGFIEPMFSQVKEFNEGC